MNKYFNPIAGDVSFCTPLTNMYNIVLAEQDLHLTDACENSLIILTGNADDKKLRGFRHFELLFTVLP